MPAPAPDRQRGMMLTSTAAPGAFEVFWQLDPGTHAFFLDVDGTLIDIAPHPDLVAIPPDLPPTLEALARDAGGALALVSGRTIESLDALFGAGRFAAAGSHGAELRPAPSACVRHAAPLDDTLRAAVRAVGAQFSGIFVEDKQTAVAMHYRARPELEETLRRALAAVVGARGDVVVLPGRRVFEVKRSDLDKGTAVAAFLAQEPFAGRTPVFIGDDVTDEAGFAAVRAAGGIAICVGMLRGGADALLPDPAAVRALIARLAFKSPAAEPRQTRR